MVQVELPEIEDSVVLNLLSKIPVQLRQAKPMWSFPLPQWWRSRLSIPKTAHRPAWWTSQQSAQRATVSDVQQVGEDVVPQEVHTQMDHSISWVVTARIPASGGASSRAKVPASSLALSMEDPPSGDSMPAAPPAAAALAALAARRDMAASNLVLHTRNPGWSSPTEKTWAHNPRDRRRSFSAPKERLRYASFKLGTLPICAPLLNTLVHFSCTPTLKSLVHF